jgi:prepilin-type N-terminal cleavage/methylation domain-containing protein
MLLGIREKPAMQKKAMTLLEVVISMAIVAVLFAVILPQLRLVQVGWAARREHSDNLQNARVIIDTLRRYLTGARRITAVSGPEHTQGFIQFIGSDDLEYSVRVDENKMVLFGHPGSEQPLGGPAERFGLSCYGLENPDRPTEVTAEIRLVHLDLEIPGRLDRIKGVSLSTSILLAVDGPAKEAMPSSIQ